MYSCHPFSYLDVYIVFDSWHVHDNNDVYKHHIDDGLVKKKTKLQSLLKGFACIKCIRNIIGTKSDRFKFREQSMLIVIRIVAAATAEDSWIWRPAYCATNQSNYVPATR